MYSIGDFSKKTGISVSTLRYYDKEGVIVPGFKADNGYRYYTDEQVISALFINNMKRLNLPLEVIRELADATDPTDMHKRIVEQKAQLLDSINHLTFFETTYLNALLSLNDYKQHPGKIYIDTLPGCGYISMEFENTGQKIRDFVAGDMMDILVKCNYFVLEQDKCMRIMCTSLSSKNCSTDLLIVPCRNFYNRMESNDAGFMAEQKTLSMFTENTTLNFSEPVNRLREYAASKKMSVKDIPIVDILCDPGDIPKADKFIAKVHIPLE